MLFKLFFSLYLIADCVEEVKAIVLEKSTGLAREADRFRPQNRWASPPKQIGSVLAIRPGFDMLFHKANDRDK